MSNDFDQFFLSETSILDLETPTGEPMTFNGEQVKVHLYGPGSGKHERARAKLDAEATKKVIAAMGSKGSKKDQGDDKADIKFLVAVTEKIENFPFPGGPEAVYADPRLSYVKKQVQEFLGDMGNFFSGGAKN